MQEMNTKKPSKDGKLSKYFKSAMKALVKARDCYIQSMTECSDKMVYATAMGCPTGQPISLPRSYSVSSSKSSNGEDLKELVRAACTRKQRVRQTPTTGLNYMPRSHSVRPVGIGRIDEDKPCDSFDEDVKVYPRSRSHAVGRRTGMF